MSDKPLFDFTKKYTKRSIAEFLLKHGVDKEKYQYRSLDTPEQIEYEVLYLCKSKLPELEKKAKLYNASVIFGGEGNFSNWRIDPSAQGAYNKLAEWLSERITQPKVNVLSGPLRRGFDAYREELFKGDYRECSKFIDPIKDIFERLQKAKANYESTIKGSWVGTLEEAEELFNVVEPIYTEYVDHLSKSENFMQFLKEFIEKDLENKE